MKPILVLCLGNDLLCDDAFGAAVASKIENQYAPDERVEILFAAVAGFNLLDLLTDRSSVIIIDSICTGKCTPGTLHFFRGSTLAPSRTLTGSHEIGLPTALALGNELGLNMPPEVDILAVEADDVYTISESMTPAVSAAVDEAVQEITKWVEHKRELLAHHVREGATANVV
jgi:hydrogenase maturation protease